MINVKASKGVDLLISRIRGWTTTQPRPERRDLLEVAQAVEALARDRNLYQHRCLTAARQLDEISTRLETVRRRGGKTPPLKEPEPA